METPYSRYIIGTLPWYSVLIVTGIILAILLGRKEAVRHGMEADTALDIALFGTPLGIIGARLYYVAFTWEHFAANPISVLYIWEGGIAIYGAVLGGIAGVFLYSRLKKKSFGTLLDIAAPGLILAQAIGRWGNYFNMEAYGSLVTEPGLQFFPVSVLIGGTEWHLATFFYESVWNLCVFLLLWFVLRKRVAKAGGLAAWDLLLYGCGRFVIEQLRTDSLYIGSLRASQWLAVLMCVGSAVYLLWGRKERRLLRLSAVLLSARWFLLKTPAGYAAAAAIAFAAVLLALDGKRRRLAALPILADLAGWAAALAMPSSQALFYLHALLCGITFAAAAALLYFHQGEEAAECRSEKSGT